MIIFFSFTVFMKLQFDFLNYPYNFENVLRIIQTRQLDKVLSCIQEIEEWVGKGYYAAGFITYEAASAFRSYLITHPPEKMPLLWFGIFEKPIKRKFKPQSKKIDFGLMNWQPDCSWHEYQQAIAAVKNHIADGDTYQVNYTLRMGTDFQEDPYEFYLHMLQAQQSSYSAYLDIGLFQILSASPELFFQVKERKITAKPMKGTAPRGLILTEDLENGKILNNEKNRAENLMIVDLLRNDLGQIAEQGSVKVSSLFDKEKYPTVWQLTSEITARLKEKTTLSDIFRALFPCGSITGAPKANTMKIIRKLEKQPREVYCGAIGIVTPDQEAIFSVPIRTLVVQNKKAVYGVGGGITWDSTSKDEYREVIHKIQVLYDRRIPDHLLESVLLENGCYFLLSLHLDRLKKSAEYFDFSFNQAELLKSLQHLSCQYERGCWKVRILLDQKGLIQIEINAIQSLHHDLIARWAKEPVLSDNMFLYHKTTRRDFYPPVTLDCEQLLFNEKDEVTEFVNGNILLCKGGKWVTPPVSSGLLRGTMCQYLLDQGMATEQVIYKQDIQVGSQIAFINSVRKWRKVIWKNSLND